MTAFSQMATGLQGSEIIRLNTEVQALKATGQEVCNLTIGDFDPELFPIPSALRHDIEQAYNQNRTNYPAAAGLEVLRTSAQKFTRERLGLEYDADHFQVAGGSRPLIYALFLSVLDPGDEIVFPVPSWNNNHYSHLLGATPRILPTSPEDCFMPRPQAIEPLLSNARVLALCSPLNPTGTMFPKKDLEQITQMVVKENQRRGKNGKTLYLLYDQIYWQLTFANHKHYDPVNLVPEARPYTLYVDGISKAFAATGVRVGWAYGPQEVIYKMRAILGHIGAWSPRAEQHATGKFLLQEKELDQYMKDFSGRILESLNVLYQGIQDFRQKGLAVEAIEPMGAIYLSVKLNYLGRRTPQGELITSNQDLALYLIRQARLAIVPFSAFGCPVDFPWFRFSVGAASAQSIQEALPRMEQALAQLK